MIARLWKSFKAHDARMTERMRQHEKLENFRSLLFMVGLFSAAWAFAWNAHIIGPWLDVFLGIGPHDIDSPGKVRWRRMWSTAICLPGIVSVVILYFLNIRDRKRYQSQIEARRKEMEERGKESGEASIHPPTGKTEPDTIPRNHV